MKKILISATGALTLVAFFSLSAVVRPPKRPNSITVQRNTNSDPSAAPDPARCSENKPIVDRGPACGGTDPKEIRFGSIHREKKFMQEHKKWLAYAEEDLNLAKVAMLPNYMMVRGALYHAQQCAEKSLKAYIVYKRKQLPPRTHDLTGLLAICTSFDDSFNQFTKEAEDINPFSTSTRYPTDALMYPDIDYAHKIIAMSESIFKFVSALLP